MTLHKVQQYWYEIRVGQEAIAYVSRGTGDMWYVFNVNKKQILGPYFGPIAAFEDYKAMIRRKTR